MDHADTLKKIGALTKAVATSARRLSWNVLRTPPDPIRRAAEARVDQMKVASEPFLRMPATEHDRVLRQIVAEESAARRQTAAVARFHLEPHVAELDRLYHEFVESCHRDTAADFPDALDRLDPAGMLMFELLKETLRPAFETASADDLLQRYEGALQTKTARGLIEAQLIEARVERGGLAKTEDQLPAAKRLRDFIDGVQELRVPMEQISDVPDTVAFAQNQIRNADLVQIRPLNADQPANAAIKAAFESEEPQFREALAAAAGDE